MYMLHCMSCHVLATVSFPLVLRHTTTAAVYFCAIKALVNETMETHYIYSYISIHLNFAVCKQLQRNGLFGKVVLFSGINFSPFLKNGNS